MALTNARKSQMSEFLGSSRKQFKASYREKGAIARVILRLATQPSLAKPWHSPSLRLDYHKMHGFWPPRLYQVIEILRHQSRFPSV